MKIHVLVAFFSRVIASILYKVYLILHDDI